MTKMQRGVGMKTRLQWRDTYVWQRQHHRRSQNSWAAYEHKINSLSFKEKTSVESWEGTFSTKIININNKTFNFKLWIEFTICSR